MASVQHFTLIILGNGHTKKNEDTDKGVVRESYSIDRFISSDEINNKLCIYIIEDVLDILV